MNKDIKIEHYLLQLDRELSALPVSQRAEIITEIKSHIRDAGEQDPTRDIDTILRDLGSPQIVAGRYLSSKGIALKQNRNGNTWFKWLAIGTVGLFGMIFVTCIMAVWYFSPLVKVDKEKGHVVLLGGLIDVQKDIGKIKIGDMEIKDIDEDGREVEGQEDLTGKNVHTIKIPFNSAKMEIETSDSKIFSWKCEGTGQQTPKAEIVAGILTFNLNPMSLVDCEIKIPGGSNTQIQGINGHMEVDYPNGNVDIALTNGKVKLHPDPAKIYDFEVNVKNGLQDFFPRSQDKNALKVKVSVVNGMVKKE